MDVLRGYFDAYTVKAFAEILVSYPHFVLAVKEPKSLGQ